jgi:hypothetical protein
MSKKLIAVASAAALALSALVAAPASATAFSIAIDGDVGTGGSNAGITASAAAKANLPTLDVLRFDAANDTETGTVVKAIATTTANDKTVSVVTTGGVKVFTKAQWDSNAVTKNARAGSTSVSAATPAGTSSVEFYLFTTSTAPGTAVFSQDGNSRILYLEGINPVAYNLNFRATSTADVDGVSTITGTVTDAFGNKITGIDESAARTNGLSNNAYGLTDPLVVSGFGGAANAIKTGSWEEAEDADGNGTGDYTFEVEVGDAAGTNIIGLSFTANPVKTLGTPRSTQFFTVNVASLADQVALLQAQLAASRPKANSVTKKRYNTLVRAHRALGGTAKLK